MRIILSQLSSLSLMLSTYTFSIFLTTLATSVHLASKKWLDFFQNLLHSNVYEWHYSNNGAAFVPIFLFCNRKVSMWIATSYTSTCNFWRAEMKMTAWTNSLERYYWQKEIQFLKTKEWGISRGYANFFYRSFNFNKHFNPRILHFLNVEIRYLIN